MNPWQLNLFERPFFHFSEYDPGPLPEPSATYDDVERTRIDIFVRQCDVFILSPILEEIVLDLVDWTGEMKTQLRSRTQSSLVAGSSYKQARWLHLRAVAIRSRLLYLETTTWKEEVARLALLAWAYMIMTVSGRRRTMKIVASRLKALITATAVLRWKNHPLLLWILIVAACASEGNTEQQAWFFENVLMVLWRSPLQAKVLNEEAAVETLNEFLYIEELQRSILHGLFEAFRSNSA